MAIADNFKDVLLLYPGSKLLKEGGQKAVFLINHKDYGPVVLKVGIYNNATNLERIQREVNTLNQINSKYYPKSIEFTILDSNRFVILEEYIESTPLSDCLANYRDPHMALTLLFELAMGLNILWSRNIVHRDVKPDNILIYPNGAPVIIDLGIARLLGEDSLTQTYAMRGPATPIYAAPEQLLNRKSAIDIRTDQYNLGIILMQLLLGGAHPFDPRIAGGGNDIVSNIIDGKWDKNLLGHLGLSTLEPLLKKLLGREPYLRFKTPTNLLDAIIKALNEV